MESNSFPTNSACAAQLIDVIPLIMRSIRAEMRSHRTHDLSVPQFRALVYLDTHRGASLSDTAEFVGLGLSSMSKIIEGLVDRNLVTRQPSPADRRYVTLELTQSGGAILDSARQCTVEHLSEKLAELSAEDRVAVSRALTILRRAFTEEKRSDSGE